jgi:hypothetical protein
MDNAVKRIFKLVEPFYAPPPFSGEFLCNF